MIFSTQVFASDFVQTDWSGGVSAATAADPANQTGWNNYSSAEAGVDAGAALVITPTAASLTETSSATDFVEAVNLQHHSTPADFSYGSTLINTRINNGAVGIDPATKTPAWTAKPEWDLDTSTGTVITNPTATFADLDGDGDMDMMVGDNDGDIEGFRNTGSDEHAVWTVEPAWKISRGSLGYPSFVVPALGDLDGDGDYDLLFGANSGGTIRAFENSGDAQSLAWSENSSWQLNIGQPVLRPTLSDLNGDGKMDILVGYGYSAGRSHAYTFDATLLPSSPWVRQTTWDPPYDGVHGAPLSAVGDLDGDDDPDLVVGWRNSANLQIVTNGNSSYPSTPNNWIDNGFTGPSFNNGDAYDMPALVDIDSDGDLDLMVGISGTGNQRLYAYENRSTAYNTSGTYISAVIDSGSGNAGFTTVDYETYIPASTTLTIDMRAGANITPDATWTDWADASDIANGGDISTLGSRRYVQYRANFSTADTSVTPLLKAITIHYVAYPQLGSVAVSGDKVSLALLSRTIAWNTTADTWSLTVTGSTAPDANTGRLDPAVGDLNGDGYVDLILGDDWSNNGLGAYRNDGTNHWVYQSSWNAPFSALTQGLPTLGDLDGDGDQDLLIGANNSSTIKAYRNDGGISGPPSWVANSAWNLSHVAGGANAGLADLDGDGDLDAMVSNVGSPHEVYAYENQSSGSGPVWVRKSSWDIGPIFGGQQWEKTIALADLDGDGDSDLLIGDNDNSREMFLNTGSSSAPEWSRVTPATDSRIPPAQAVNHFGFADLDDDGDMDVLIGRSGYVAGREFSGASSYAASGTYHSAILDFGSAAYTTLDYNANLRSGTSLTISVRAGNTPKPNVSWTGWSVVSNGGSLAAYNGNRYLQYKIDMSANSGNTITPELSDITINYTSVVSPRSLISSAYDTGIAGNFVTGLAWSETLTTNSDIQIQLRTAPDNSGSPGTWTSWAGPDGTNATYWNSSNSHGGSCSGTGTITCSNMAAMFKDGANDQWFQYRVTLVANGATTPTFSDVSVSYSSSLPPGVTLSKTSGLATAENGASDSFDVVLDSAPTSSVTINLSSNNSAEAVPTAASLSFNTGNWNVPQTVTIAGVNDDIDDGDTGFTISVDPSSGDANYNALATQTVSGINSDDDTAGITLNQGAGLTTSEAGPTSDSFTIVLNSEPLSNVVIALSSSDSSEGSVSPATLTFTPSNWNSVRTVTVTGVDDSVADGDITYNIITAAAASASDPLYNGLNAADVSVTNVNDDSVSIVVSPLTPITTSEAGGSDSFTVVLGSEPTSRVSIAVSSSNLSEGRVTPTVLEFDADNWNMPQTVSVIGIDDAYNDGDINYTIFIADASSADPAYAGYALPDLNATNVDDDVIALLVTPTSGLVTSEAGGVTHFNVRLASVPSANVYVDVISNDISEGAVSLSTLHFDASDWDAPHSVAVTGADDMANDGDQTYTVTISAPSGGDSRYNALSAIDVTLTNLDNDGAAAIGTAFSQIDWSVGTISNEANCSAVNGTWIDAGTGTECVASDPGNQAGWRAYATKEAGVEVINNGAELRSAIVNKTIKHSRNADFAIATSSKRFYNHDDFAIGASLSNAKINNGAVGLKPATFTKAWTAKPAWNLPTGMSYEHPALADLDGDGDLDLMVGQSNGNVEGYRNNGTDDQPSWELYPAWRINRYFEYAYQNYAAPMLGDFDGDGDNDLFLGYGSNHIYAMENTGSKDTVVWTRKPGWDLTNIASGVSRGTMANLDGSGYPELLLGGGWNNPNVYVFQYNGSSWSRQSSLEPPQHNTSHGFPNNEDVARATAGDLDDDGDIDLIVGYRYRDAAVGFENVGNSSSPNWSNSFNQTLAVAGDYHTPVLGDLDSDGDLDFFAGSTAGYTLYYYENTGTVYNSSGSYTSAVFDTGGHVGFTTLDFIAVTPANTTLTIDLRAADSADFTTNSSGWQIGIANAADISTLLGSRRYVQYRVNLATSDTSVTPLLKELTLNYAVYPWGNNVDAVANGLNLKVLSREVVWTAEPGWDHTPTDGSPDANNGTPRPTLGDMDGDGDLDLLRGDNWSTAIGFYRNDGNNNWSYVPDWTLQCCTGGRGYTAPTLVDMDNDGDMDVMMGTSSNSSIVAYENLGDNSAPVWAPGTPTEQRQAWNIVKGGSTGTSVSFADLDNDGDLDAMVGDVAGNNVVWGFENTGTTEYPAWLRNDSWNLSESQCNNNCAWWAPVPELADLDGDGDYDIILANNGGDTNPYAFENVGDNTHPVWGRKAAWDPVDYGAQSRFALADLDDDGDIDLMQGTGGSTIYGYRNTGVSNYAASGSYTSAILDFGTQLGFTTLDYTATVRSGTTMTVELRSGNTATPDGSWSGWSSYTNGANISAFGNNRYLQYRVSMTADNTNNHSPSLYDISFNYQGVATDSELISTAYNSNAAANLINGLGWTETLAADTEVRVQLRSAADNSGEPGSWSDWLGPDGSGDSYWNSVNTYAGGCSGSGTIICSYIPPQLRNGSDNQWLQYKVILVSGGATQVVLSDIDVYYVAGTDGSSVISVSPTSVTTSESGSDATFQVSFNSAPASGVDIYFGSGDISEGTVSPNILNFAAGDLGPKTVTVTHVDDSVRDGDVVYKVFSSATISSDASYNNLIASDVTVTNSDDDLGVGGVSVSPTSGLVTSEAGDTAIFHVVLTTVPTDNVTITLDSSDETEGVVTPNLLTFTPSNWNVAQTVTVTGQDDDIFDQSIAYTVVTSTTASYDLNYSGIDVPDVAVVNTNDEVAEVVITPDDPINGLNVNEDNGFRSFSITLASKPTADVRFSLSSSDTTEGMVIPFTPLTFTPDNWNIGQAGTLYAGRDTIIDGDVNFNIVTSPFFSFDPNFNNINPPDIQATCLDNDGVFDINVRSSTVFTSEDGAGSSVVFRLSAQPTADVIIYLTSSDPGEGYVPEKVVIPADAVGWQGVLVPVIGVDDGIVDVDQSYTIITSAAVSNDPNFNGIDPVDISVINRSTNEKLAEFGQSGAHAGRAVAYADVNGDGFDDVIVGAPDYDDTLANSGRVVVYDGAIGNREMIAGWTALGDQVNAYFGQAIANAGDVNNDGYDDVIIGAYGRDVSGDEGRVYIYHGSATGLQSSPARVLDGAAANAYFGYSVAAAGDVNNDGYSDVVIGAYGEEKAYVYLGSASGIAAVAAQTLVGDQLGSRFGISVSGGVDVDNDSYDDVIVGADLYDNGNSDEGRAYLYQGNSSGVAAVAAWSSEVNQDNAYFGHAVAAVGDVNKDGFGDVVIGAYGYSNGHAGEGRIYGYYGSVSGLPASPSVIMESNQAGAKFGYAVAYAGDVNKDSYADIIVGAPGYDNGEVDEGYAVVYYGSAAGINPTPGLTFESDQAGGNMGVAVTGNGYFNADAYADVIVGADLYDGSQIDEGRAYVYRTPPQTAGVTITPASGLQTTEKAGSASISLVLDAPPVDAVVLEAFIGDTSEATLNSYAMLTFTTANWDVPQNVYFSGLDDTIDDGDVSYTINILVRSSDPAYDNLAVAPAVATNINDDYTVFVAAGDVSVGEEGPNPGTFTFSRTGPTSSSMTVIYAVGGSATNSSDYASLGGVVTIPAGQSSTTLTVTPIDDALAESAETVTLTVLTNGNTYLIGGSGSAALTIVDNDAPGITVAAGNNLATSEAGGSASFSIVLNTQPTDDVTIALSSDTNSEGSVWPSSVSFTTANWNVPQTMTVTGVDDQLVDGNVPYNIVTAAAVSADGSYSGMSVADVALINIDDDSLPNIAVVATQATIVENGGVSATFMVSRDGPTVTDLAVSFTVSGSATSDSDYASIGATVVIPAGSSSVTIPVTPQVDALVEGDETVVLSLVDATSYVVDQPGQATVTIQDSTIQPYANFGLDQQAGDGSVVTVKAVLSKTALLYPVTIPYTVSGTASNPADHNAVSGNIVINSGREGSVIFNVVDDGAGDPDETVVFTMGSPTNAQVGPHNSHAVTIVETNEAPMVSFETQQAGLVTSLIVNSAGLVTITATVDDPNPNDSHSYDWSLSNNSLVNQDDGDPTTYIFDPAGLLDGFYKVRLSVTDNGVPVEMTSIDLLLEIAAVAPILSASNDADHDGIPDSEESFADSDGDGIPDYLDSNTLASNELQLTTDTQSGYIMRTDAGLSLKLGDVAFAAGSDGAQVSVSDIGSYGDGEGGSGVANAQDSVPNNGGYYYDFEISELPKAGQSARLVIPRSVPIPSGAVYRKYDPNTGWQDFVEDANNSIASAPGTPGECPLPGDAAYTAGLSEGHYCMQLTLEDGGPNDQDGIANHVIEDPAQLGEVVRAIELAPISSPTNSATTSGGGGGTLSIEWLLLLMGYGVWRKRHVY